LAAHVAKQRAAADVLNDRLRTVLARAEELAAIFGRVTDAFERLGLVALNAGLEGARLGESTGRALLIVSEAVRDHAARGSDSARELGSTLHDVAADIGKLQPYVDQLRQGAQDAAQEVTRVTAAAGEAERAVADVGSKLEGATGCDPRTARVLALASEHASALAAAIGSLGDKPPTVALKAALRPALAPIAQLLAAVSSRDGEEDEAAR
jgi:methyl-accepting chemotaxis protein